MMIYHEFVVTTKHTTASLENDNCNDEDDSDKKYDDDCFYANQNRSLWWRRT